MAQSKQTKTDPMLEGTGQPGELANTPTSADSTFAQETAMQEQQVEQDPVLEGTGLPGELYGTPEKPSLDPLTEAKREASKAISKEFNGVFWLRSLSPEIDFPNLNKHAEKGKK